MSSVWGNKLKLSIFGESHGEAVGVVIDNLPSGINIDVDYIKNQMLRRSPGKNEFSSLRKESDDARIISGIFNGKTTGAPLCALIYNEDVNSKSYRLLKENMRPGHSDYPAFIKYEGFNDYRGGGHFSGRLTAPLLFAGALAKNILEKFNGIYVISHISSIKDIKDEGSFLNSDSYDFNNLRDMEFPVFSQEQGELMKKEILDAKNKFDSVGGTVETVITNVPAGYGEPFFDSVESKLSHMIFSIPAVKGIEFGSGFDIARMNGSVANDAYVYKDNDVAAKTNHNGGILGGITNGMPIIFKTAIKPTPSISKIQETVNIKTKENVSLQIHGRHDPCIVQRALPVIEGAASFVLLDMILEKDGKIREGEIHE